MLVYDQVFIFTGNLVLTCSSDETSSGSLDVVETVKWHTRLPAIKSTCSMSSNLMSIKMLVSQTLPFLKCLVMQYVRDYKRF